ncbi:hypothetical protein GCM10011584_34290 [Nocardioides phosphati]|uniref:Uncharacterized protein n=1 Tax=Nocardioides phosphati TaxID=1867775 RepID=A0ABQ2NF05_9ACTN|nr:hypothetical protein [Nocardioides phosphati]GGO94079.1 hypothetical protein GCM10011584_34290 [Nocardioides phosphati]
MTLNIDEAERAARALLDNRITSVRALVEKRTALDEHRELLATLERQDAQAYAAALRDGWTADELRKLGIAEPEKAGKPRRKAAPKSATGGSAG